jgi:predicted MFS family arabinose efflux permease
LLPFAEPGGLGWVFLGVLIVLFAENGACRATVESLAGAEATRLAPEGQVGAVLGALRFWRPVGIVLVALLGGVLVRHFGVGWLFGPLAIVQGLAVVAALLIREDGHAHSADQAEKQVKPSGGLHLKDPVLWTFIAAMVLFHLCNAPAGAYLGLFLKRDFGASEFHLSTAFVISMVTWLAVVRPAGWCADRFGRRPLLMLGWAVMTIRLILLAVSQESWQVLMIQVLDGLGQAIFAVTAAAWVSDRLADPRRSGEVQVLVGSSLVLGSALGPALSMLVVNDLGYRGMFGVLAAVGVVATLVVVFLIPETRSVRDQKAQP